MYECCVTEKKLIKIYAYATWYADGRNLWIMGVEDSIVYGFR